MGLLFGHFAESRAIVERRIPECVQDDVAGLAGIHSVLVVADLVNCEEEIDEVARSPQLLQACVVVDVRAQELASTFQEKL